MEELRGTIRGLLPEAEECIAYGSPAFKVGGRAVAGFAAFKDHLSYLPHSGTVLASMQGDLDGDEWSKGALKFPVDAPLPGALVSKLVAARLRSWASSSEPTFSTMSTDAGSHAIAGSLGVARSVAVAGSVAVSDSVAVAGSAHTAGSAGVARSVATAGSAAVVGARPRPEASPSRGASPPRAALRWPAALPLRAASASPAACSPSSASPSATASPPSPASGAGDASSAWRASTASTASGAWASARNGPALRPGRAEQPAHLAARRQGHPCRGLRITRTSGWAAST